MKISNLILHSTLDPNNRSRRAWRSSQPTQTPLRRSPGCAPVASTRSRRRSPVSPLRTYCASPATISSRSAASPTAYGSSTPSTPKPHSRSSVSTSLWRQNCGAPSTSRASPLASSRGNCWRSWDCQPTSYIRSCSSGPRVYTCSSRTSLSPISRTRACLSWRPSRVGILFCWFVAEKLAMWLGIFFFLWNWKLLEATCIYIFFLVFL